MDKQFKNGKWIEAEEEPYYPNIFERIKHFFGIHLFVAWKCLICGKIRKGIPNRELDKEIIKYLKSFSKEEWLKKLDEEKKLYEKDKIINDNKEE